MVSFSPPRVPAPPSRAFSADTREELLHQVGEATGTTPEERGRTTHDNVFQLGETALLFTAALLDHRGRPVSRGVLLPCWTAPLVGETTELIPAPSYYEDHGGLLYRCALAHLQNVPLALHGHTGVGKTELVRYFCALLRSPLYRMNLHGLSTTDDVVGKLLPAGQGTVRFQDGLVTTAVRHGGILLLEEMNATGQEVWFALHGLLDGSRSLVLVEKDNEVVHQHPSCRIFSTFNPAEYPALYPGTKELSAAYLRRWASVRMGFAARPIEERILLTRFPAYCEGEPREILDTMLEVARVARKLLEDRARAFDFVMSTGTLVAWAELTLLVGPVQGARMAFYDVLEERIKAVFRDQIFAYVTDWDTEQLDTIP